MNSNLAYNTHTHVVDILGNVAGRDQPIMLMSKAIELVNTLGSDQQFRISTFTLGIGRSGFLLNKASLSS